MPLSEGHVVDNGSFPTRAQQVGKVIYLILFARVLIKAMITNKVLISKGWKTFLCHKSTNTNYELVNFC